MGVAFAAPAIARVASAQSQISVFIGPYLSVSHHLRV
jgi:hypothetical protein